MILFENEDIVLEENDSNYILHNKNDVEESVTLTLKKNKWCILGKTYREIKHRLSLFNIDARVLTWENFDIVLISEIKGCPSARFIDVEKALNIDKYSHATAYYIGDQMILVDLRRIREKIEK